MWPGDKRLKHSVTLLEIITTISSHNFVHNDPLPDPDHKHHCQLHLRHTANGCMYVYVYVLHDSHKEPEYVCNAYTSLA
jgi:hypothetical protein